MSIFDNIWPSPVAAAAAFTLERQLADDALAGQTRKPRRIATAEEEKAIDAALSIVRSEMIYAITKFKPYNSLHEAYGIISEEVEEFFDEVKANDADAAANEAVQVAATAARVLVDLR